MKNQSLLIINPRDMNSQLAYVHHLNYLARNTDINLYLLCADLGSVKLHPSVKIATYKRTGGRFLFALKFYQIAAEIIFENKIEVVISSYGHFNSFLPFYRFIHRLFKSEAHKSHLVYDIRSASVSGFLDNLQNHMFGIESYFYDSTMAVSDSLAKKIFGKRSANCFISGVGTFKSVNPKNDDSVKSQIHQIRNKWKITPSSLMLIYVGTLSNRGIDKFIEYFEFDGDFHFFIIGDGSQESTTLIEQSIAKKGLHNNIYLCGRLPYEQLPAYLFLADVGIASTLNNPSLETQPMTKLYDYREYGLITLASDNMKNENIDADVFNYEEVNSISKLRTELDKFHKKHKIPKPPYWDEISTEFFLHFFTDK